MFSPILIAQTAAERIIYLDSAFHETNQINHRYYRIISDFYKNQMTYKMIDHYKSGGILSEYYSTDKKFKSPIGLYKEYFENGNLKKSLYYEESQPIGVYTTWYENGSKQTDGEYIKAKNGDDKKSILKIDAYWDSEKNQTVTSGYGYYSYTDENGCEEGKITNGLRDSIWAGFDRKIDYTYVEKYRDGNLIAGISTDNIGVRRIYHHEEIKPEFSGGINEFYRYVGKTFRVPQIEGLQGKLFVSFVIQKDGEIDDIQIIRSLGEAVDQEAYRVLSESPAWKPGKIRGIPIKLIYSLPINIQSDR